jgi:predicted PurR-regulated permease PerM
METTNYFSAPEKRLIQVSAILLSLVLISIILRELDSILKPFFIAIFMVYVLEPGVSFLAQKKIPRTLCYLIMVLIVFVLFYLLGVLIYANIEDFTRNFPAYETRLSNFIAGILKQFGIIENVSEIKLRDMKFLQWLPSDSVTTFFSTSLGSFFDLIGNSAVVAFFMLFLIAEAQRFGKRIQVAYGAERANQALSLIQNINQNIRKYILVKLGVSFGTAVLAAMAMGFFRLDFFILFGVLTFLLNFIPYIGSIVATILPVVIAFLQFHSPWTAFWLLVILLVIQNLMGSVLEPKITGRQLNLSPLIVLISVMFWGWIWGAVGMLLSIPIITTIHIIFENIAATRSIAVMMSDL